jgi:hypothetical protein
VSAVTSGGIVSHPSSDKFPGATALQVLCTVKKLKKLEKFSSSFFAIQVYKKIETNWCKKPLLGLVFVFNENHYFEVFSNSAFPGVSA